VFASYPTLLQAIPDQDLTGTLVVLLGNRVQSRVIGLLVADQGTVCLDDNLVILAVLDCLSLLVPWV